MSKGGPLVRFAHDAERPLRIEDGSGGGRTKRAPSGTELRRAQCAKQAKRKSNEGERGGAASGAHEGRAQCAKQAEAVEAPKG